MIKRLLVAAVVGLLSLVSVGTAHGDWWGSWGSGWGSWGSNWGSGGDQSTDPVSQDWAAMQADMQQFSQDFSGGNYDQATTDLNQLIQHRQQYYSDCQSSASGSSGTGTAAPMIVPLTAQGKY